MLIWTFCRICRQLSMKPCLLAFWVRRSSRRISWPLPYIASRQFSSSWPRWGSGNPRNRFWRSSCWWSTWNWASTSTRLTYDHADSACSSPRWAWWYLGILAKFSSIRDGWRWPTARCSLQSYLITFPSSIFTSRSASLFLRSIFKYILISAPGFSLVLPSRFFILICGFWGVGCSQSCDTRQAAAWF